MNEQLGPHSGAPILYKIYLYGINAGEMEFLVRPCSHDVAAV